MITIRTTTIRLLAAAPLAGATLALATGTAFAEDDVPPAPTGPDAVEQAFPEDDEGTDDDPDGPGPWDGPGGFKDREKEEDEPDECDDTPPTRPEGPQDLVAPGHQGDDDPEREGPWLKDREREPTDPDCEPKDRGGDPDPRVRVPNRIDAGAAPLDDDGLALTWLLAGGAVVTATGAAFAGRSRARAHH